MGAIADRIATMQGCSLRQIVDEIARMEDGALFSDMDGFDDFWQMWPHKVGKPDAKKAYAAAIKRGNTHRVIMEGVVHYIHDKPPDRPWLNPGTFLRQERFNDQPAALGPKPSKTSELRNDLRSRIQSSQGSADTGPVRRLAQRDSHG